MIHPAFLILLILLIFAVAYIFDLRRANKELKSENAKLQRAAILGSIRVTDPRKQSASRTSVGGKEQGDHSNRGTEGRA